METAPKVCCPKCGSESLSTNKKGFSGKKAVAGVVLTGGVGLLAGTIGSNKLVITCLNCGNRWRPGQAGKAEKRIPTAGERKVAKIILCVFLGILAFVLLIGLIGYLNAKK